MTGPLFVLAVALLVVLWLLWRSRRSVRWSTINVNGLERRYLLLSSAPGARNKPLLLCFHGGLAGVKMLVRTSGIAEVGQRQGYTVVFPEAKDGWIDSRPERGGSARDLDFIDALLDSLISSNQVDPSRLFALGISNGGLFLYRMAGERPQRFAGLATALANMPVAEQSARSGPPVPIAMIFGSRDRIMPREGGSILRGPQLGAGGEVVSAQTTLRFWLMRNGAEPAPQLRRVVSGDHPIDVEDYFAGPGGAPVRYITVGNWGHRWPCWGEASSTNSDSFNAADLVMEFFSNLSLSSRNAPAFAAAAGERNAHG